MRVAIIGAGGFAGRRLAEVLAARGHDVSGYGRSQPETPFPGAYACLDVARDPIPLHADTAAVFYLAQASGQGGATRSLPDILPDSLPDILAVNTLGPARAAAACPPGCRAFFHASTGSVYAPSFAPLTEGMPLRRDKDYVLSKVMAEEVLDLCRPGLQTVSLRLFALFGRGQRRRLPAVIADAVREGRPVTLAPAAGEGAATGGMRLSFTFVDDACAVMADACELALRGEILPARLNLAGPCALSLREFAERVGGVVGRRATFTVLDTPREQDFVADTGLLRALLQPSFRDLDAALAEAYRPAREAG